MTLLVLKSQTRESLGEFPGHRIKNRDNYSPANEKSHFYELYLLTQTHLGLAIGSPQPWHPLLQKGGETDAGTT